MEFLLNFFKIKKEDARVEIVSGLTTFLTMSYIIIIIPNLLSQTGMPYEAVFTALLLLAGFANVLSGIFVNIPFAIAPYLSDSVFIAYTLYPSYSWREIMAVMLFVGIFLFVLTVTKFRINFVDSMPNALKFGFTVSLGFYLLVSGLKNGGIVDFNGNILSLSFGNFQDYHFWLTFLGVGVILLLNKFRVKMAVIFGILLMTLIGVILKDTHLPSSLFAFPSSPFPIFFGADFSHLLSKKMITLFFLLFLLVNTEFHGTLVSVMMKYNVSDFKKLKRDINKFLFADSSSTVIGSLSGMPASGVYADSVTGISAGGKTGLTSVVIGLMFLISLFIAPVFKIFPSFAYASALIFVGLLLLSSLKDMKYNDITEYLPFWLIVCVNVFTLNLGVGMAFAFLIYPVIKLLFGRIKEVPKEFLVFTVLSVIFFVLS